MRLVMYYGEPEYAVQQFFYLNPHVSKQFLNMNMNFHKISIIHQIWSPSNNVFYAEFSDFLEKNEFYHYLPTFWSSKCKLQESEDCTKKLNI